MHVEVRIDDSVLMLRDAAEGYPPVPSMVHLFAEPCGNTWALSTQTAG